MADTSVRNVPLGALSAERLRNILRIGGCKEKAIDLEEGYFQPNGEPKRHLNWPNIAALAVWLLSVDVLLVGAVRSRKRSSTSPAH